MSVGQFDQGCSGRQEDSCQGELLLYNRELHLAKTLYQPHVFGLSQAVGESASSVTTGTAVLNRVGESVLTSSERGQ